MNVCHRVDYEWFGAWTPKDEIKYDFEWAQGRPSVIKAAAARDDGDCDGDGNNNGNNDDPEPLGPFESALSRFEKQSLKASAN